MVFSGLRTKKCLLSSVHFCLKQGSEIQGQILVLMLQYVNTVQVFVVVILGMTPFSMVELKGKKEKGEGRFAAKINCNWCL